MLGVVDTFPCAIRRGEEQVVVSVLVALHDLRRVGFGLGYKRFADRPLLAVLGSHAPLIRPGRKIQQVRG